MHNNSADSSSSEVLLHAFLLLIQVSLFVGLAMCAPIALQAQSDSAISVPDRLPDPSGAIVVRYFHPTIRCVTCLSIEDVAQSTVNVMYEGDTMVVFLSYNIDDPENVDFVTRFNLTSSALFVCSGSVCDNLTDQAFESALGDVGQLPRLLMTMIEKLRQNQQ